MVQIIDQNIITNVIGYTGFTTLISNNVPTILQVLSKYIDGFNVHPDTTENYSIAIQISAGSLILTYGILKDDSIIYYTMPGMIFLNVISLCIKLYFYVKQKRNQNFY